MEPIARNDPDLLRIYAQVTRVDQLKLGQSVMVFLKSDTNSRRAEVTGLTANGQARLCVEGIAHDKYFESDFLVFIKKDNKPSKAPRAVGKGVVKPPKQIAPMKDPKSTETKEIKTLKRKTLRSIEYCQNPGCAKVAVLRCGRCQIVSYCSVNCQRQDWDVHQKTCQPYQLSLPIPPVSDSTQVLKQQKLEDKSVSLQQPLQPIIRPPYSISGQRSPIPYQSLSTSTPFSNSYSPFPSLYQSPPTLSSSLYQSSFLKSFSKGIDTPKSPQPSGSVSSLSGSGTISTSSSSSLSLAYPLSEDVSRDISTPEDVYSQPLSEGGKDSELLNPLSMIKKQLGTSEEDDEGEEDEDEEEEEETFLAL